MSSLSQVAGNNDVTCYKRCGVCLKTIAKNQKSITCNGCNNTIHIKCNEIDEKTYIKMKERDEDMFCIKCIEEIFPFSSILNTGQKQNTHSQAISENIFSFFKGINDIENLFSDDGDQITPLNCKYVDLNSFNYKYSKNNFSLFHLNIASLALHKDELETLLKMLNYKFDVVGLTETKIKKEIPPIYDTSFTGYTLYKTDTESDCGGTALYIADHYNCKPRGDLDSIFYKTRELESTFVEIITTNKKNIICGCIYRHPKMDVNEFNVNYLNPLLTKLGNEGKTLFFLGDFNIDLLKTGNDTDISNFFDSLSSNLLVPHIVIPTRVTATTRTLIDNIFSNSVVYNEGISGNLTISISDHLAQFLIIPDSNNKLPSQHNLFKRDMKNFNHGNFLLELNSIDWPSVINIEANDPNESLNNLESSINLLVDKYMPLKKLTKKELRQKQKPWITKDILRSIKEREKIHRMFVKEKEGLKKEILHQKYKKLRNNIVTLCRVGKKSYYEKYFTENANNIKNTWKGIKSIINIKSSNRFHPTSLTVRDKTISDPKEIADTFNIYFSTIASKLQSKIHHTGHDFHKYLDNRNEYSFFITPTDKHEIIKIIMDISINKATGPNSIPTNLLHIIKDNISGHLSDIVNLSFRTGKYFEILKISKTVPIFKEKGSYLDCCNYRPISLLSNINKIIEKLMYYRLYNFLSSHNCIYKFQFGFRNKYSTTHALLNLTEDIRKALDENLFSIGIFIDLQKAFDTVDHEILLTKLNYYGVRGVANEWFRSYLKNRQQFVSINGFNSNLTKMLYGVPQGSVLGPLLFLIYINDLHKSIKYCTIRHFADDTTMLNKNGSLKQLQKRLNLDLRNLNNWLKANKISLNAGKTELMIFRHPNKKINYNLKIKINGKKLFPSEWVKYLGIIFDSHLNWCHHIDRLAPRLSRANGMLSKIRHYVPVDTLRTIYHGIFSSLMSYGSLVWGQFINKNVSRITKLQDKAIRIINFAQFIDSRNPLYKNSKILKFEDHIKVQNCLFIHDCIKGNIPPVLSENIKPTFNVHSYNTRAADQYHISLPKIRTEVYGIKSVSYNSTHVWNILAKQFAVHDLPNKSRLYCKKLITKHYLENY